MSYISTDKWFNAISDESYDSIKYLIKSGADINAQFNNSYGNFNALISFSWNNRLDLVKLLLEQSNIIVDIKDHDGTFIESLKKKRISLDFLIDYDLQKKILSNNRVDIILFFKGYNLVHPKIEEENTNLFKAADWGLIL